MARILSRWEDGHCIIECPELSIFACGETFETAVASFLEDFAFAQRTYAQEADEALTADDIELKKRLIAHGGTDLTAPALYPDWESSALNPTVKRQDPCEHCLNNPKNGGSGICACTLSMYSKITC